MKRINNKGYTLIELLSIIIILGLITSITITVILTVLSNSKNKSDELSKRNIRDQAEKYIYEGFSNNNWKRNNSITGKTTEYKCVTVQDLIDVGYYKQSIIEENSDLLSATDVVKITRDSETKAIISKEIMSNSPDCEIDSGMSIIECRYDQGYAMEKDVQILFHNSTDYEKRVDLKNISLYAIPSNGGLPLEQVNGYYIANGNEAHVTAKANGVIFAYTVDYGKQIASLYCNVVGIDRTPPKVKLEVIDNNDLKCTITDKESGLGSYKLCIKGTSHCNTSDSEGYEQITPSTYSYTVHKDDVENGNWLCVGKDKVGHTASASVSINNSPEATATAKFIAEELENDDTVYGPHNGDTWTNKKVRLTGTIIANVDTWYKITDSSNTPSDSEWEKYEISNELTTFKAILEIDSTTNKPYYLHVKAGKMDEIIQSLNVKVDKTPPTCNLEITKNKTEIGLTIKQTCDDSDSLCTYEYSNTIIHSEVKTKDGETKSYIPYEVKDNAGNVGNCTVEVKKTEYKNYCTEKKPYNNTTTGVYKIGCDFKPLSSFSVGGISLNSSEISSMNNCLIDSSENHKYSYRVMTIKEKVVTVDNVYNNSVCQKDGSTDYDNVSSLKKARDKFIECLNKCTGSNCGKLQKKENEVRNKITASMVFYEGYTCNYKKNDDGSYLLDTSEERSYQNNGHGFQRPTSMSLVGYHWIVAYKGEILN